MAPNDTAYKRWICHSSHKLLCKLCRTLPPRNGGPIYRFWASLPCGPTGWLALILTGPSPLPTRRLHHRNQSFLSKVIEKVISSRILTHIADNDLIDKFQSAYRCGHSTETALLRVYSDIVTMVGKGNGSYLVLLDLSAAFDTIDHDTLFVYIREIYWNNW